jgi:Xaa-Pro aminopeptidase
MHVSGTGCAALNVHEGPHRVSSVLQSQVLLPGMIVSNEPGYYENGNYGIRIENLLEVVERPEFGTLLGKGDLSAVLFQRARCLPMTIPCTSYMR